MLLRTLAKGSSRFVCHSRLAGEPGEVYPPSMRLHRSVLRDVADDRPQLDLSLVSGLDLLHGGALSESMASSRLVPLLWTSSTVMQVAGLANFAGCLLFHCVARLPIGHAT